LTVAGRRLAPSIPQQSCARHTQTVDASAGYSGTPQATRREGDADVVLAFVPSADRVRRTIEQQERRIFPAGALWIAWPRAAAGHVSDVDENLVRDTALLRGLVDVKVAALDTDWSALKLVWRRENRGTA
jgi:hypothetical protein